MQIVLIRQNEICKTVLPRKISGQHQVTCDINGTDKLVFSVSAKDGKWFIRENRHIDLLDAFKSDENGTKIIEIKANEYYPIRYRQTNEKMIVLIEQTDISMSEFRLFEAPENGVINIGFEPSNNVSFHDELLSDTVGARILFSNDGRVFVKDNNSINGTYLNGKRIQDSQAFIGDEIYLVGLRVILGNRFIAVNNPRNSVTVNLRECAQRRYEKRDIEDETELENLFSSAPRFKRSIRKKTIQIDPPPSAREEQGMPWALVMGPSITMAFGSVFSSVYTIQNITGNNGDISTAMPTLVMAVCMVLGTIIWPIFAKRFEKRSQKAKTAREKREYFHYLNSIQNDIDLEIADQEKIIRENNPSLDECIARINSEKMTLWERSPRHDDFLDVMIGSGCVSASIELSYQKRGVTEKATDCSEKMLRLVESEKILKDVPITISFLKSRIVGLIGDRNSVIKTAKALLLELTALHNYSDLKLIFIFSEKERSIWDFVKWIPHTWDDEKTFRYVANDVDEAKELSNLISNIRSETENRAEGPHYLIVAADRVLTDKIQSIKEFVQEPSKYSNISMLALYDERRFLPKGCSTICSIEGDRIFLSDADNITDKPVEVTVPVHYDSDPEDIFVNMANIKLDVISKNGSLPTEMSYLEMYQVGMPEYLDVLSRWTENDSVKSLAAPIGIDANGYIINLDIHEKAHGPHGLIAGMTGSGKSEFIISYIASLAINYSPEEVAFVLIDFKGGGMADVFKDLPHLAGSITNLDGNELQRSFIAIESELEKRQTLFKTISEEKKISNIDIYKYQKLRKTDKTLKPLPHLIIISDEFAELKQQHADFMEQLIRIARIGRSLGVHLILATQKPDGVVDDQIKSNIKFKVCLKVQDKSDSQSVIGRPEATLITNAGRFYFQVGYNEIFEYGQSPWSGAPYYPAEQYHQTNTKRIDVLNEQGRVIYRLKAPEKPRPEGVPEKQIDALVGYLKDFSKERGYICEKLWLEPLKAPKEDPRSQDNDEEHRPFVLNPFIGQYDDLQNQKHRNLCVPLTNGGNAIVYGSSGSGKLSFLNRFILSLVSNHSPEEVRIFALDYDSGSLAAFENAPHIGKIVLSNDYEAAQAVFDNVIEELEKRKVLFRKYGGDYQNFVLNSGETVPNIVLVISNFMAFTDEFSSGEDLISKIAREGKKYGIFVVVTAIDASSVRYSLVPLFSNLYVLQLNNEDQYSSILGKTNGIYPSKHKGRGIFKKNDITYEFQTEMVFEEQKNTYEAISFFCSSMSEKSGFVRKELDVMPRYVTRSYFERLGYPFALNKCPVAVNAKTKKPIVFDFSNSKLSLVISDSENKDITDFIFDSIMSCNDVNLVFDSDAEEIEKGVTSVELMVGERAKEAQKQKEAGRGIPDFDHFYILIRDYAHLTTILSEDPLNHLNGLIVGLTDRYHIHFIVFDDVSDYRDCSDPERLGETLPCAQGLLVSDDPRGKRFFNDEIIFSGSCEKGYGFTVIGNEARLGKMISGEEDPDAKSIS